MPCVINYCNGDFSGGRCRRSENYSHSCFIIIAHPRFKSPVTAIAGRGRRGKNVGLDI